MELEQKERGAEPRLAPLPHVTAVTSPVPQVTVHYDQKDGAVIPKRVHTIVISVQHDDCISLEEQKRVLKEKVDCQEGT